MFSHHQIAAATRIGMLTRERDTASACAESLHELGRVLPLDAAALVAIDPRTSDFVQMAGVGWSAETSELLAIEFAATPWYGNVLRQDLPPSISEGSDLPGYPFRSGRFYAERIKPAGFRDGITGALRHRGRFVGLIHLSAELAGRYDTDARRLLTAVMPAMATFAGSTAWIAERHDVPADGAASFVTSKGVIGEPGRDHAEALEDEEFHRLVWAFAASDGRWLRLLWPVKRDWHRVVLRRHRCPVAGEGVLVHEKPTQPPYGLSTRELDVLTRAATGQTDKAIARALLLSPRTVHSHIARMLRKTGTASRAEATALALRDGLLRPTSDNLQHFVE
jgi:DNA-binding CsgD family transcriptional regulator